MQTQWENMQEDLQSMKNRFKTMQDKTGEGDGTDDENDRELCSIPASSNNHSKNLCLSNQRMSEVIQSPEPIVDSPKESPPTQARPSFGQYMNEPQMNVATILQTLKPFDGRKSDYALFITRFARPGQRDVAEEKLVMVQQYWQRNWCANTAAQQCRLRVITNSFWS
uniref:Uncharacterized protein n=1 Tax=Caenorhabditis japonica TaxID=281687 RepID=A0A8R1E877_CAEJA